MTDYATRRRQLWIASMSRDIRRYVNTLFASKNAHGIDLEELSWWISERAALLVCGVLVYGVLDAVL